MATITPTERQNFSWGGLKGEVGKFTFSSGTVELKTKLGYIVFLQFASMGTLEDTTFASWPNSISASTVEDDAGFFHISAGLTAGDYTYFAVGRG